MTLCARCGHQHWNSDGNCTVNDKTNGRDCLCDKDTLIPKDTKKGDFLPESYYFETLSTFKTYEERVKNTILVFQDRNVRDLPDWEFIALCWHYWINFKIGDVFTHAIKARIKKEAQPETIRRTRQRLVHPELETLKLFQEQLNNTREFSPTYWELTEQIKQFWIKSQFIPRDIEFLKAKGIKQSAIFEWSITELNSIC